MRSGQEGSASGRLASAHMLTARIAIARAMRTLDTFIGDVLHRLGPSGQLVLWIGGYRTAIAGYTKEYDRVNKKMLRRLQAEPDRVIAMGHAARCEPLKFGAAESIMVVAQTDIRLFRRAGHRQPLTTVVYDDSAFST
ncbi:hypothetical protein DSCW_58610 [Desulfosarcina widdelii]|uniref:Uncharacterized protein n=1 Tax=Desulfosarcina widdelii TaxID=947919 RepID=A0A5K7ZJK0_9BACT|nr:hypothetical protein DSCW_58610 [Desulfosarcina widdelii]